MGWLIVAIIVVVLMDIACWKEVFTGTAATWRFYLWIIFTLYAVGCLLYAYILGWRSHSGNSNEEIVFAAVMLLLGAFATMFIDRMGLKFERIVKDIIEANRRA